LLPLLESMAVDPGTLFLPVLLLLLLLLPLPTMSLLLCVELMVGFVVMLVVLLLRKLLVGSDSGAAVRFPVEDIFSIYVFLTVFR